MHNEKWCRKHRPTELRKNLRRSGLQEGSQLHRNRQNRKPRHCQLLFIREKYIKDNRFQRPRRCLSKYSNTLDIGQLEEWCPSTHVAHAKPWVHSPAIHKLSKAHANFPNIRRCKQKDQKFKFIFNYVMI